MSTKILYEANSHLSKDTVLSKIITKIDIDFKKGSGDVYKALLKSIVSQQLSVKVAATIFTRFMDYYKGSPSPKQVYNTKDIELRKIGLSGQKSAYVKNVAEFFISNEINKKMWKKMSDEEIIERLISIKGVGKWTVQMVLMFHLDRQDVLPLDDLIIKNTMIKLYKVKETGKEQKIKLEKIASKWSPYRSIACRYLWASKDFVL